MKQQPILNILIACEESQAETMAFRALGHNAYSCDIVPCKRGTPREWHIVGDVSPLLRSECAQFTTQDGQTHTTPHWDLIICHPPCTYLCKVGSPWMMQGGRLNEERYKKMLAAREFFYLCLDAPAKYVAVENPIPMRRAQLPPPSCYASPHWYGVKYTKKTLYWLKNLPPLLPEIVNPDAKCLVRCSRGKYRSRTFPQMADAIARQWSSYILDEMKIH